MELRESHPKLPLVLRLSARAWPSGCRRGTVGIHPSRHLGKHRTHQRKSTEYSTQHTESMGGDHLSRPLFLCSHSISCWGSSRNPHFQDLPIQGLKNWQKMLQKSLLNPAAYRSRDASAPWSPISLPLRSTVLTALLFRASATTCGSSLPRAPVGVHRIHQGWQISRCAQGNSGFVAGL